MKIVAYQPITPISSIKPIMPRPEQREDKTVGDTVEISSQGYEATFNSESTPITKSPPLDESSIGSQLNLLG